MRRKDDTLRDTLLDYARCLADTQGVDAVNIRAIARRAGVATGTVYNYFSNKDEILLALTEEYWKETLHEMETAVAADSFCGQLEEIFAFLKKHIDSSAGMLMRSLANVEAAGQERMTYMQAALEKTIIQRMEQDSSVRKDIWTKTFTKEKYARFMMMNILLLLREKSPDIRFFMAIIKQTIY